MIEGASVRPKTVLFVLVGAHIVNDFYSTVLPAFLPAVAEEFDLDYAELGILSFAFMVFTGILQPALGNLADQQGRRRWMLVTGFVIGAAGFLAMAAATSFWVIVAMSLLCGLGGATYHPQASAFIVSAYPERRGRMLGIHGWGGSIGHFLAPAVAVLAIAAFDWRIAMAVIAIPLLVAATVVQTKLKETTATPSATMRGVLSRQLLLVALALGAVSMVGRSFLTFFVKMLVDEGWDETTAGMLLGVILLVGVVSQPLGGWAYDHVGGRVVTIVSAASTVVLIGLFAVTSGAASLLVIAAIAFFGFSLFPVALAFSSHLVPPSQTGAATGVVFGVAGLMTAAGQPVVGAMAEATGDIRAALALQLPVALIGLAFAMMVRTEEVESPTRHPLSTKS